jgi:branched-chain amino acid transport system substrate-binding protein
VEKANLLVGGWPDDEAIISQLEGLGIDTPAGYLYIRPDNHQGYKDAVTGFSKNVAEYPFQILDPARMVTIPIRNITAPPNWPKPGKTWCM